MRSPRLQPGAGQRACPSRRVARRFAVPGLSHQRARPGVTPEERGGGAGHRGPPTITAGRAQRGPKPARPGGRAGSPAARRPAAPSAERGPARRRGERRRGARGPPGRPARGGARMEEDSSPVRQRLRPGASGRTSKAAAAPRVGSALGPPRPPSLRATGGSSASEVVTGAGQGAGPRGERGCHLAATRGMTPLEVVVEGLLPGPGAERPTPNNTQRGFCRSAATSVSAVASGPKGCKAQMRRR